MNQPHQFRNIARPLSVLLVALAVSVAGASTTLAEEESNPCADYATKLCEKAGPTGPTCQAIRQATDLMPADACKAGLGDLDFSFARIEELKKQCLELRDKLCADLGEDTKTCAMVRNKVPSMPPAQCKQMLSAQYPMVLADLKRQEEANKPLDEAKQKEVATGSDAVFGPEKAKVTVVEFSDFQCPYCSRAAAVVKKIKEKYPKKVRFVFRNFPLSFHKNAHLAHQAAQAAAAEGRFWPYHDLLFKNQKALERPSLEKYAEEVGLDMAAFKKALDEGTYKAKVDADVALGNKVAVRGTPTMFVNGQRVPNPTDFNAVAAMIDGILK